MDKKILLFILLTAISINLSYSYEIVTQSGLLCNDNTVCEWPETSSVCPTDCGTIGISKYTSQRAKYIDQNCQHNGNGHTDSCASSNGGTGRFNNLQAALDTLVAGDTLYIHSGNYWRGGDPGYSYNPNAPAGYEVSGAGTATQPIIVTAADVNNKPVLHSFDPQGISSVHHPAIAGVYAGSGEYIILDNLEVHGMIAFWKGNFDNNQIQNIDCSVGWGYDDGNWSCIRISGTGMDEHINSNNIVHHNNIHDVAVPAGISLDHTPRPAGLKEFYSQNTIWEFNTVSNAHWGYDFHHSGSNPTMRFNIFNQITETGIRYGQSDSTYTSQTYGNIIHGNTKACIENRDGDETLSANGNTEIIYNNLCSYAGRVFVSHHNYNLEFSNNIISNVVNQGDMTLNIGVKPKATGTSLYLDHNAYDSNTVYSYGATGYGPVADTLATWQSLFNQDANSQEAVGGACSFEPLTVPGSNEAATSGNFMPNDTFCTAGSTEGGMLGPYGLVSCIGHTCDDVEDGIQPPPPPALSENSYVILNPALVSAGVISLADNNVITAGDRTLNLDLYETGSLWSSTGPVLSQGMVVTGTGPFEVGSNIAATDMPVHASMLGTQFVTPHSRYSHWYYLVSPNGDTTAQVTVGAVHHQLNLPQGEVVEFNAGEVQNLSAVITSASPILVIHRGDPASTSWYADASPVPPAATELWGFRSKKAHIGAVEDDTHVTVYSSDGHQSSYTLQSGDKQYVTIGDNTRQGQGSTLHLVADKPIGAVQIADDDGVDQTAFFPTSLLNTRFGLPRDTQYIAVACPGANTSVTLYNGNNPPETRSCNANGNYPGKAYFGSPTNGTHIQYGAYFESDKPVYAIYEVSSSNDEHNILGSGSYATPFFSADMEGSSPAIDWMDARTAQSGGGATITFPQTGSSQVAQFNYRAGSSNEVWLRHNFGAYPGIDEEPVNELWLNFEYQINNTSIYNPNTGQASKVLYFNWSSPDDRTRTSQVVLGAMDNGNGHRFRLSKELFDTNGHWIPGGEWLGDYAPEPIPENEKLYLQLHIRNSTDGAANGLVQLYSNGELIIERSDVVLNHNPGHSPNHLVLTPQISHTPPGSAEDGYSQYDNVSIYDTDPGFFRAP